jgi:hypothetical protein
MSSMNNQATFDEYFNKTILPLIGQSESKHFPIHIFHSAQDGYLANEYT